MKIGIASDHRGVKLKAMILEYFKKHNLEIEDFGPFSEESVDYPDYAEKVAARVSKGELERGILICGSGIGMSIAANKFPNVRAGLSMFPEAARLTRLHNNANILVLSGDFTKVEELDQILDNFLNTEFEGDRHQRRIDKIRVIEKKYCD